MEQAVEPVGVIAASLVFGAVVLKLVDFIKYARNGDWNGVLTLLTGWLAGLVAVFVFVQTEWADEITIGSETLDQLTVWSKVVFAFAASSVAAVLYDFKKAVDNTDTASTPKMQGGSSSRSASVGSRRHCRRHQITEPSPRGRVREGPTAAARCNPGCQRAPQPYAGLRAMSAAWA